MIIPDWAPEDRPREKMMANGEASLTNAELLAILLRTGEQHRTAVDVARDILHQCSDQLEKLHHILSSTDDKHLKTLRGVGPAKACTIRAALELGRRLEKEAEMRKASAHSRITDASQLYAMFNHRLSPLDYEELWAVYTSKSGVILHSEKVGEGGVDMAVADLRRICRPALQHMASCAFLCHNHPHSQPRPSRPDLQLTQKAREALALFDVRLVDHVIIADGSYYSMSEQGEL